MLSGVLSLDCGMAGSELTKLGCMRISKMASVAFEIWFAWTGCSGWASCMACAPSDAVELVMCSCKKDSCLACSARSASRSASALPSAEMLSELVAALN